MKKVVYSIKKVRNPDEKLSGSDLSTTKERCYVSAFQKQANVIQGRLMKLNSIAIR